MIPALRFVVPILSGVILACAAIFSLTVSTHDGVLAPFVDKPVVVVGTVIRDSDVRDRVVRITVKPYSINDEIVTQSKNIIVSGDRFTAVAYGDRIQAVGTLRSPKVFETDSARTFNYPKYLWTHGVSQELPFAEVRVLEKGGGNMLVTSLLALKHWFIVGIERAFPEPYAALAEGLLLGEKRSLGGWLYDAFTASGVVHIIVLSGYNVALVINAVLFIALRMLPRLAGYSIAAVFIVGFAILTGGSETTIRATIMALLMMVARVLNRPATALRGLLVAASVMALMNPFLVLYDLSFQLSVLATLGLILFSDRIATRLSFLPERFGIREIVATTLATQVTVLPLLILSIGAVSLVFLPANALILPLVPLAMLLSFIAALLVHVVPFFALPFSFVAYTVLAFIIFVAEFFGTLPFALIQIPPRLTWAVLSALSIVYAGIFFMYIKRQVVLKSPRR